VIAIGEETRVLASCAALPPPCDRLRIFGQDRDGRVYLTASQVSGVLLVEDGQVSMVVGLPADHDSVRAAGAVADGLVANMDGRLYSLRAGETVWARVPGDDRAPFGPTYSVRPDGQLVIVVGTWIARAVF
jgi:hypothetical protein